jgi:hypothetical protein
VAEYQLYVDAFDAQNISGNEALNRVATAERKVAARHLADDTFDPDKAGYYVDTGDPPLTGSIRATLKALKSYNDALGALASGAAADAMATQIGGVVSNLAAAGLAINAGFTGAAVIGTPAAKTFLETGSAEIAKALPFFKEVATLAGREAFRRQLVLAYPHMRALLEGMRAGTPAMYDIIERSYVKRGSLETATGISAADAEKLEQDRQALAGWVILLDKTLVAMTAAVQAAMTNASPVDLAAMTEASVELRVLAEKVQEIQAKR